MKWLVECISYSAVNPQCHSLFLHKAYSMSTFDPLALLACWAQLKMSDVNVSEGHDGKTDAAYGSCLSKKKKTQICTRSIIHCVLLIKDMGVKAQAHFSLQLLKCCLWCNNSHAVVIQWVINPQGRNYYDNGIIYWSLKIENLAQGHLWAEQTL